MSLNKSNFIVVYRKMYENGFIANQDDLISKSKCKFRFLTTVATVDNTL